MNRSWDRQTDETEEWYDRFMLYLYMGPSRTIAAAHSFAVRLAKEAKVGQLGSWQRMARRRQWKQRAAAFDADFCKSLAEQAKRGEWAGQSAVENSSATGVDEKRLQMVAELLQQVYGVLRHADLLTLSKEEARQLLPTFRLFFRDLLRLHQSEVAQLLAGSEGKEGSELNADALVRFMTDGGEVQRVVEEIKQLADAPSKQVSWQSLRDVLAQLYADEASARRIAAQAQLDCSRIQFSGRAVNGWHSILTEAANSNRMESVIEVALREYGANTALVEAVQSYRQAQREEEQAQSEAVMKQPQVKKVRVRKR
jgi:hypothetical protein